MDDHWKAVLRSEEGTRLFVYDDATGQPLRPGMYLRGNPTIGVGRCLNTQGITDAESDYLLDNDIAVVESRLPAIVPSYAKLTPARQFALCSMAFNLGLNGLSRFRLMRAAIADEDWPEAKRQCLDSAAARELPTRYLYIADLLLNGE